MTATRLYKGIRPAMLAAAVAVVPLVILGQSDRGTITGTVQDPVHAAVPNASVVAKHVETGTTYDTKTTSTGNYTLPSLPAGHY